LSSSCNQARQVQPAGTREIHGAADLIVQLLADPDLPQLCHQCGLERVGPPGGSRAIARAVLEQLQP